jgi:hypothetical protein
MKHAIARFAVLVVLVHFFGPAALSQSLAEAARKEAQRRRELEQNGVSGKVILEEEVRMTRSGNLTLSSPDHPLYAGDSAVGGRKSKGASKSYSAAIKKLDREIEEMGEQLVRLRQRLQESHRSIPKSNRKSVNGSENLSEQRMRDTVQKLESRLKRSQQERLDTYRAGRKAGFLPGELEGRESTISDSR